MDCHLFVSIVIGEGAFEAISPVEQSNFLIFPEPPRRKIVVLGVINTACPWQSGAEAMP